jgi:hypothetical protein
MVELGRAFHTTAPLTVTPRTVPLPSIPLGGSWTGAGDNRPRAFASGSAEDVTVREYRRGDDLRRVHWRSSARMGDLMVRREEQPWQSRATLFLDNRDRAHRGQGIASSFETAVSAAASIALHLSHRGYAVRLVSAVGDEAGHEWHSRDAELNQGALMEALAVVQTTHQTGLGTDWLREGTHGGLVIGIFGAVDGADAPVIRRMLHQAGNGMALALDVERWGHADTGAVATTMLVGQGWRVGELRPGDRLDSVWQELGRRSTQQLRGAGTAS